MNTSRGIEIYPAALYDIAMVVKERYGFYRLDLAPQRRALKKSGLWFRKVIENNGFGGA